MSDVDILADVQDGSLDTVQTPDGSVSTQGDAVQVNQLPADKPEDKAPVVSLRDQISSSLKGEEVTPPVAQQDGRPRNPDGTFATAPEAPEPVPTSTGPLRVPQGFDPKHFAALPAETQQYVGQTMEAVNNAAQRYSAFEQLIAPRYQAWALNGMTPEAAINQLLALSDFAGRDPQGFVKYFAQQQNLNLEDLAFGPEPVDPTVAALQGQIGQLQQQLSGMTNAQYEAQQSALVNTIAQEIEAKDASGTLKYPHMEALGDAIMPYIQVVRTEKPQGSVSEVIQDAYERACWANPNVRQLMQANAVQAQQAQQTAAQVEAVRKAQKAGSSVSSGTPSSGASSASDSTTSTLRDQIKASMAAHSPA